MRMRVDAIQLHSNIINNTTRDKTKVGNHQIDCDHSDTNYGVFYCVYGDILMRYIKVIAVMMIMMTIITPVMGMSSVYDECNDMITITEDDMRSYIRAHQATGYTTSTVYVDTTVKDYEIKKLCRNNAHKHMQAMPKIVAHKYYKLSYQSIDSAGEKWEIKIEERTQNGIGPSSGFNECTSPCESWETSHMYDIGQIHGIDLCSLYNYMASIDKLSGANMTALIANMAAASEGMLSIVTAIGTAMVSHGSKIPCIGMASISAGGVILALATITSISDQITNMSNECISCAEIYHP